MNPVPRGVVAAGMSGPEVVRALHAALVADGTLRVLAIANEGLMVEAPDGGRFIVEVASQEAGR